jgi:hypothetical protein
MQTFWSSDTGEEFKGSRDLDHTNLTVQNGVKDFLSRLKALGFKGWRWDVAKGFAPVYFGNYIQASQPYYSVGENWDGNATNLKNWIDGTYAGGINSSTTVSGAFDFSTYYTLSKIIVTLKPIILLIKKFFRRLIMVWLGKLDMQKKQ